MITESKVMETFCMADDFCKFFDAMMAKYTLKSVTKRKYHRDSTMSKEGIMLVYSQLASAKLIETFEEFEFWSREVQFFPCPYVNFGLHFS